MSLFSRSRDGMATSASVPLSTYQSLIKKLKQIEMQIKQNHHSSVCNKNNHFFASCREHAVSFINRGLAPSIVILLSSCISS